MPNIKLTDRLGFEIDAEINPDSSIARYIRQLTKFKFPKLKLAELQNSLLDEAPIKSADTGISFEKPLGIGVDDTKLTIGAGVSGNLRILTSKDKQLFDPEVFGDAINIAGHQAYLGITTSATLSSELAHKTGNLGFGFDAGNQITLSTYRLFEKSSIGEFPKFADALKQTVSAFTIPGDLEDLKSMTVGSVATVEGTGSIKFSGSVDVLSLVNPLAVVNLPDPVGAVKVSSGNAIKVGASFAITGAYQVRAQKIANDKVRLGYYKKRGTEFVLKASAAGGLSIGPGEFDAIAPLLKAISSDPSLDAEALRKGGLNEGQIEAIKKVLEAGISRKLEVALGFELNAERSAEAAFLFEIEINNLDETGRKALANALDGDLSALARREEQLPAGITLIRSIFTEVQKRKHALKFNLLGIYNFISVSTLILKGTVMFDPATGEVIITDKATASRIAASTLNFAADSEKLRKILAESVLITAAYRCSKLVTLPPELKISHSYFELHTKTNRTVMKNNLDVFEALALITKDEKDRLIGGVTEFGKTMLSAETFYDDQVANELFLRNGEPRAKEEYESAGLQALALLVQSGEGQDFRTKPARDPKLWKRMKKLGQPAFSTIGAFKKLSADQLGAIKSDYSVIVWWADSMTEMSESLAEIRQFLADNPNTDPKDEKFTDLRKNLAGKFKHIASTTKSQFGDPWGLVAMDQCSNRKAAAQALITGSKLSLFRQR
ncbi:MAG TPA: hypothetical protein VF074_24085 [Pyrinomonadaceae bacterium]